MYSRPIKSHQHIADYNIAYKQTLNDEKCTRSRVLESLSRKLSQDDKMVQLEKIEQ